MEDELFDVKIRAIATSPQKARPKQIITDLARAFTQYKYVGLNSFKFKKARNIQTFAKEYIRRTFYHNKSFFQRISKPVSLQLLNIKELSSLIHFPHSRFNQNPRLAWQKFKIVPAPDNLPTE
ncbi:MAG: hypothetical protein GXP45_07260 [bacterium]|nr:hypothetical protein [bacterium]